jgi:protocatechuate 3,4-dioxygenase alpha subunit
MRQLTPFSTVGPFFKLLVRDRREGTDCLVTEATRGERITIRGVLLDGMGSPVDDGLVEIWQADADGRFHHPADPQHERADPAFTGFGRAATASRGQFAFQTIKPGELPDGRGGVQAPHVLVGVMARGIMSRCWTRMYFADDRRNGSDAILQMVPVERRGTLLARSTGSGEYEFNIVLQGPDETVFFDA